MTWKSTALVSGTGLLLTWLANMPPAGAPRGAPAPTRPSPSRVAPDIQAQADRLRARVRSEVAYQAPSRNPFRFSEPAPAPTGETVDAAPPDPVAQPSVAVTLSGVAIDIVAGREERTAILHTPSGLVFAHEGETVGAFQVGAIREDGVDLIRVDDGTTLRLP